MNWIKNNWQLKLIALGLAISLWLVLYFSPPEPVRRYAGVASTAPAR